MLPIGFAALLGLALGRFFKVAVLAPGVVATTAFAALVEWTNGASAASTLAVAAIAAGCLQLGYFVGSATSHSHARTRPLYASASATLSADR
jgi:hypothetical protein